MLSIFNDEITTLETQLTAIANRINDLRQAETKAEQATATLTDLINTVSPLGKLGDIKRLVLSLFTDNNEPTPPSNDDSSGNEIATPGNLVSGDAVEVETLPILEAIGQQETSETSGKLDEQVEAQQELEEAVEQQAAAIAPEPVKKGFTELKMLSQDVAYLVNTNGEILAGYAGFAAKRKAEVKGKELSELLHMGYEVRSEGNPKKRLSHKYELRLLDISMPQLEKLAAELNTPAAADRGTHSPRSGSPN
jgi:hypothetical protein